MFWQLIFEANNQTVRPALNFFQIFLVKHRKRGKIEKCFLMIRLAYNYDITHYNTKFD